MGTPDPGSLLGIAVDAARAAGELLTAHFRKPALVVGSKSSPTDLVSEADRASEALIRERLSAARPGDAIVGEEGGATPGDTGLRWVVDPLDGTVNFLFGIPQWCVSIACEDDAGGIAGVVLDPARDEIFTAVRGGGAFLGDVPLRVSEKSELAEALVATGFSYLPEERAIAAERLVRVLPRVRDIRRLGSAARDLAWTAAGRFEAYYEVPTHHWDRAAGELLVREAGGVTSPLDPIGPSGPGLVAAGPGLHDALRALVLDDR